MTMVRQEWGLFCLLRTAVGFETCILESGTCRFNQYYRWETHLPQHVALALPLFFPIYTVNHTSHLYYASRVNMDLTRLELMEPVRVFLLCRGGAKATLSCWRRQLSLTLHLLKIKWSQSNNIVYFYNKIRALKHVTSGVCTAENWRTQLLQNGNDLIWPIEAKGIYSDVNMLPTASAETCRCCCSITSEKCAVQFWITVEGGVKFLLHMK